jgi:hypothetical protein
VEFGHQNLNISRQNSFPQKNNKNGNEEEDLLNSKLKQGYLSIDEDSRDSEEKQGEDVERFQEVYYKREDPKINKVQF